MNLHIKSISNIAINSQLALKPEYQIHPHVSGNKYRKLYYNLQEFYKNDYKGIVTFGGAFSNHIAATAAAGKELGIPTIGIIRGEELEFKIESNSTLSYAQQCGMTLRFVTRKEYATKHTSDYLTQIHNLYPNFYVLPEGGSNALAVRGCEEILSPTDTQFDIICCAVGTGGTISGLINSSLPHQKIIGFPALKGDFLNKDIRKFATKSNWELATSYHFGGYAKVNSELIRFMNHFKTTYSIPLDPIYTAKMMFGIFDMIEKHQFSRSAKILAIHTGGLQGVKGMNQRLEQLKHPLID